MQRSVSEHGYPGRLQAPCARLLPDLQEQGAQDAEEAGGDGLLPKGPQARGAGRREPADQGDGRPFGHGKLGARAGRVVPVCLCPAGQPPPHSQPDCGFAGGAPARRGPLPDGPLPAPRHLPASCGPPCFRQARGGRPPRASPGRAEAQGGRGACWAAAACGREHRPADRAPPAPCGCGGGGVGCGGACRARRRRGGGQRAASDRD
mmetsp:Transcript_56651/g.179056  ORF Transcript_56651/g.179056 Transcript_56651/m.179056 type:complete len:206 (-) Transcript_56651:176-793(-)